jgi:hypothetical protein
MLAVVCGGITQEMIFTRCVLIFPILYIWRILHIGADIYIILDNLVEILFRSLPVSTGQSSFAYPSASCPIASRPSSTCRRIAASTSGDLLVICTLAILDMIILQK